MTYMKQTLKQYCDERGLTLMDLAKMSDVSTTYLYNNSGDLKAQPSHKTMQRIYEVTKAKYGVGLRPQDYLDHEYYN